MRAGKCWKPAVVLPLCVAVLVGVATWARAGTIDARLEERLRSVSEGELISVSVMMGERLDYVYLRSIAAGLPRGEARELVRDEAVAVTSESQEGVRSLIEKAIVEGRASEPRYLHAVNAVRLLASPSLIGEIAGLPEVRTVIYNERAFALVGLESGPEMAQRPPTFRPQAARGDTAWGVLWIGADEVWQLGFRGHGALVAIIDTGIWYYHTDLSGNMWTNPGEIPNNFIDDDNNGYVDDYYGFNFDNHTSDPIDAMGHGTHVAGTVAGDGTRGAGAKRLMSGRRSSIR
ncbi:hypothetical protein AMJ39_07505 [candidate division TA06 bacterium DG_24]|uniref:Peptidase S8/S53 domain-containing protein n=1 Tax=candidate division TA06 bacterium DG_24 TaxID=1703770 RepID=A0A0S7WRK9_UNCT6|nr:MAG: hypothetical protein AMJ39_07505 [candidate division TA06 bacterium DG_24]